MGLTSHEGGAVTALHTNLAVTLHTRAPLVFLCGEEAFRREPQAPRINEAWWREWAHTRVSYRSVARTVGTEHSNEVNVRACEMPLEANILLKEHPMLIFISMTIGDGQHDVLLDHPFRRKGGGPRLRGVDSG